MLCQQYFANVISFCTFEKDNPLNTWEKVRQANQAITGYFCRNDSCKRFCKSLKTVITDSICRQFPIATRHSLVSYKLFSRTLILSARVISILDRQRFLDYFFQATQLFIKTTPEFHIVTTLNHWPPGQHPALPPPVPAEPPPIGQSRLAYWHFRIWENLCV